MDNELYITKPLCRRMASFACCTIQSRSSTIHYRRLGKHSLRLGAETKLP